MLLSETMAVLLLWMVFIVLADPDGFRTIRAELPHRAEPGRK
jgi:hypothetical protein